MSDIYTYTSDMMRPCCPECGREVEQFDFTETPEEPWEGTCPAGHTFTYQLEDDEDDHEESTMSEATVNLSLDDIDMLDYAIEDYCRSAMIAYGHTNDESVIEYEGPNDFLQQAKALSQKINALREGLLFDEEK